MTQDYKHPIAPPPRELVQQWRNEGYGLHSPVSISGYVATRANQWGADQELEACIAWMTRAGYWAPDGIAAPALRAARRPKSEKQQALEDLDALQADLANYGMGFKTTNIRRALEQLPDHK